MALAACFSNWTPIVGDPLIGDFDRAQPTFLSNDHRIKTASRARRQAALERGTTFQHPFQTSNFHPEALAALQRPSRAPATVGNRHAAAGALDLAAACG